MTNDIDKGPGHFIGIYENRVAATQAINRLLGEGFRHEQLSMIVSNKGAEGHFGFEERKKVAEGAAAGGAVGVGLGAIVGALAAVGAIAIPGVGLIAAGLLVAALAGAGATGAAGGFVGGFVGMGFSETEAKFFEEQVERGNILLGVNFETQAQGQTAKRILDESDAKRVAA